MPTAPDAYVVTRYVDSFGTVYPLQRENRCMIGRTPTNQIVLSDDLCSREHAEIYFAEGKWMLRDLGSLNGSRVNGERIQGEETLTPSDEIQLGRSTYVFVDDLRQLPTVPKKQRGFFRAPLESQTASGKRTTQTFGHLYDLLSPAAQQLSRIPRIANLIGRLPPQRAKERLSRYATAADVFWEVYTYLPNDDSPDCGILADGLKVLNARRIACREPLGMPNRRHQINRIADLLGAIAFEMLAQTDAFGRSAPALNGMRIEHVRLGALKRFERAGAMVTSFGRLEATLPATFDAWFESDWQALLEMDLHGLKHLIFSTDERDDELRWSDVTTLAFFAAYWACRWATPDELAATRAWIPDSSPGLTFEKALADLERATRAWIPDSSPGARVNSEFHEFWLFAAEMPDETMRRGAQLDRSRWVSLFTPFYDGSIRDEKGPIRSTEFIYRSWDGMERWAPEVLQTFQCELVAIRRGDQGEDRKKIADQMMDGFILLIGSGKAGDTGEFEMGDGLDADNPAHEVHISPFRLHSFCVTSEEYELFDPRHKFLRWWNGKPHPLALVSGIGTVDDHFPAVMINWYDAWCFATWCGCRLPTEAEWEYACRAGSKCAFSFEYDQDGCKSDDFNFKPDTEDPFFFPAPTVRLDRFGAKTKEEIRCVADGCTIVNDACCENQWGFWQMHGNVWEWCLDSYDVGFYISAEGCGANPVNKTPTSARVLRGGSYLTSARDCRSAARSKGEPDFRYVSIGFRLAQSPVMLERNEPGASSNDAASQA